VCLLLEILLGVEDRAVIAFFAKNHITTKAIEAVTYGAKKLVQNPLENEARSNEDEDSDTYSGEDTIKSTTLDVDTTDTENTSDSKLGILTPTLEAAMTPYQKVLRQESKLKKQTINHAINS
jgi:hypothetical protein